MSRTELLKQIKISKEVIRGLEKKLDRYRVLSCHKGSSKEVIVDHSSHGPEPVMCSIAIIDTYNDSYVDLNRNGVEQLIGQLQEFLTFESGNAI